MEKSPITISASVRGKGQSSNRLGVDMRHPPKRRIPGPIIDAHTHVGHPDIAALFVEAARVYQIDKIFAISSIPDAEALKKEYGQLFEFYYQLPFDELGEPDRFEKHSVERIDEATDQGFKALKFWFKPQFNVEQNIRLDDPLLYPIFERAAKHNLPCLVHIADPDIWFERVYNDEQKYGTKRQNYQQLTNTLKNFKDVTFIGAHFACDPEHLDHVQELLDEYPNLVIDSSATKWIVREISKQPEAASAFIKKNADRILFGSDLVTFQEVTDFDRYASRYWAHQMLWESEIEGESPIDDPDCDGIPTLNGINLPDDVLEKLYWSNAARVFGITPPIGSIPKE